MDKYFNDTEINKELEELSKRKSYLDEEQEKMLNIPSKYRPLMVLLTMLRILLVGLIALTMFSLIFNN